MSHPHFIHKSDPQPTEPAPVEVGFTESSPDVDRDRCHADALDNALDRALRTVPLPDGLIVRLSTRIAALPGDSVDQLDWLGW